MTAPHPALQAAALAGTDPSLKAIRRPHGRYEVVDPAGNAVATFERPQAQPRATTAAQRPHPNPVVNEMRRALAAMKAAGFAPKDDSHTFSELEAFSNALYLAGVCSVLSDTSLKIIFTAGPNCECEYRVNHWTLPDVLARFEKVKDVFGE